MKPAFGTICFLGGMFGGFSGMAQKNALPLGEELPPRLAPAETFEPSGAPSTPLLRSVPVHCRAPMFRRLGWRPPPQNPFALLGVVDDERRRGGLLVRHGSAMGIYAAVGEEVGEGYRIVAVDRCSVRLRGVLSERLPVNATETSSA